MRTVLYIMGAANCGSTLLTRLLASHSQVASIGELKATAIGDVASYTCGCGEAFADCCFWRTVTNFCGRRGVEFDIHDFRTQIRSDKWLADKVLKATTRGRIFETLRWISMKALPQANSALEKAIERNAVVIDAVCDVLDRPIFLDASKDPTRAVHLSRSRRFDTKVIHLVRDGRAVVASYKKRAPDHARNVELWRAKTVECERAKRLLTPSNVLTIRYEDLCKNIDESVARILQMVGATPERDLLGSTSRTTSHIIGHGSRLGAIDRIEERVEWPSALSAAELELFERQGGAMNRGYGYEA
jgi:hypothetical protein